MGIGGYFELEVRKGSHYHCTNLKLNSGRNALQYLLKVKKYRKIYLPYLTCNSIKEAAYKAGVSIGFYSINDNFKPMFDFKSINIYDAFLFINYFGICDHIVSDLATSCPNLIIDNSQAFFAKPIDNVDTFYSARKFFGVPDGAYLYLNDVSPERPIELSVGESIYRFGHLLTRIEIGPEAGYELFRKNNSLLAQEPILQMSLLTDRLLKGIEYQDVIDRRLANFKVLHSALHEINDLKVTLSPDSVPMVYPFLCKEPGLKFTLLRNNVYVATYWPDVLKDTEPKSLEYKYADEILHLPLDQRYGEEEMQKILQLLKC